MMKSFTQNVYERSLKIIPIDVRESLQAACTAERNERAKKLLTLMVNSVSLSESKDIVICQDTGVPEFFLRVGTKLKLDGDVYKAMADAVETVTVGTPLRSMAIHPAFRTNAGTNCGEGMPIIHTELVPDADYVEILSSPKGAGCEVWSSLKMFGPVNPIATMKKFVIDTMLEASGRPCPPVILGVGWGGTFNEVALLAKRAAIRPLNVRHHESEIAKMETDLLKAVNSTNIGPMGLGGDTTALAVNIETAHTHRPWNPVAVNVQDWISRRVTGRLYEDGRVDYNS